MKVEVQPVSNNIARAHSAIKAGLLDSYAPAKSVKAEDTPAQLSWGPAMRR